jgi:hypothetical protein
VIPPIKNSATSAGSAVSTHSRSDLPLAEDVAAHPVLDLGRDQRLGQQLLDLEHLHPAHAHHLGEHVVFGLGPGYPQHVVEEQLLGVGRGQPHVLEPRPVYHHPPQRPYF